MRRVGYGRGLNLHFIGWCGGGFCVCEEESEKNRRFTRVEEENCAGVGGIGVICEKIVGLGCCKCIPLRNLVLSVDFKNLRRSVCFKVIDFGFTISVSQKLYSLSSASLANWPLSFMNFAK